MNCGFCLPSGEEIVGLQSNQPYLLNWVSTPIDVYSLSFRPPRSIKSWVVGRSAEENITGIKEIVDHALAWELRSGATFESEKTALVHFTRNSRFQSSNPISIKGIEVSPCKETKILGVLMDSELRYKNHIKKVSGKGLKAVLALKRI